MVGFFAYAKEPTLHKIIKNLRQRTNTTKLTSTRRVGSLRSKNPTIGNHTKPSRIYINAQTLQNSHQHVGWVLCGAKIPPSGTS
jgi:hypothetical protein